MSFPKLIVLFTIISLGLFCSPSEQPQDIDPFAKIQGAYLGQTPPGLSPQVFAPGLITTEKDEGGITVYPGGRELYFWTVEPVEGGGGPKVTIFVTKERNGSWTRPEAASFSGEFNDGYPALHPDGSRLFFQSDRPIDSSESLFQYNIWYVDREGDGWSEAKSIGRPINGRNHTGGASVTRDGTLYYTLMNLENGQSEFYRSEYINGDYQEPVKLPGSVNAFYQNTDSYVDPDDRYLVFCAFKKAGHDDNPGDLYIAYRNENGRWSDAALLGPTMNSKDQTGSVTISPDGEYVFFTRINPRPEGENRMGLDLYWADADILQERNE